MNWNTIYITGNDDFWEDVNKRLSQSDLNFLTGHMEQRPDNKFHGLYWLDSEVNLRTFKEAVGGKLVWKYRLRFSKDLEQTVESSDNQTTTTDFSDKENAMIKAIREKTSAKSKRTKKKTVTA